MKQKQHSPSSPRILLALAASLVLLQACAGNPLAPGENNAGKHARVITITSTPPGATVRADGKKLGTTPLEVNLEESFSRTWVSAEDYGVVYRLDGTLTVGKTGCEDYSVPVTEKEPSGDIHARLDCETTPPAAPAHTEPPAPPADIRQRLQRLEQLRREGAITAEEYRQHRERILEEL